MANGKLVHHGANPKVLTGDFKNPAAFELTLTPEVQFKQAPNTLTVHVSQDAAGMQQAKLAIGGQKASSGGKEYTGTWTYDARHAASGDQWTVTWTFTGSDGDRNKDHTEMMLVFTPGKGMAPPQFREVKAGGKPVPIPPPAAVAVATTAKPIVPPPVAPKPPVVASTTTKPPVAPATPPPVMPPKPTTPATAKPPVGVPPPPMMPVPPKPAAPAPTPAPPAPTPAAPEAPDAPNPWAK